MLTVLLVVHNEEQRLAAAIEHAKTYADEVLVVDQQSTDGTLAIARRLADRTLEHPHAGYCEYSWPVACREASGDWILLLGADEQLSEAGRTMIRIWMQEREAFGYLLRVLTTIDGAVLEDATHLRLFRKGLALFDQTIHHEPRVPLHYRREIRRFVVIEHFKTRAEQDIDDARYEAMRSREHTGDADGHHF